MGSAEVGGSDLRLHSSGTGPLVGRSGELSRIEELIRDGTRLVTITGPGGVGKTRLALEIARRLRDRFDDGAAFVSVASVRGGAAVAPTLARSLGLPAGEAHMPVDDTVVAALRHRRLLLVVDNFEQVVDGERFLGRVVDHCPRVAEIVTSRRRLRLGAERIVPLPPLPVPPRAVDGADGQPATSPESYAAVRMFCDRAAAISPELEFSSAELAAIAEDGPSATNTTTSPATASK